MAEREASLEAIAGKPLSHDFGRRWWIALGIAALFVALLVAGLAITAIAGIGRWGNDMPFVWGFDLANYSWWIGIADGTALLTCLLVLWRAPLRLAVNRCAEALALAAAICAGVFPVIHLGRPALAWWTAPIPQSTGLFPNPLSALTWDFWAIIAHLITVATLVFIGALPDMALMRDRAKPGRRKKIYGLLALGWTGSSAQWAYHARAHRLVALAMIPFIFAMQSVVALELASTIVPDWHDSGLPIRLVFSHLASGLAVAFGFIAILKMTFGLHDPGDRDILDRLGHIVLAAVLISTFLVGVTGLVEFLGPPSRFDAFGAWTTSEVAWISWLSVLLSKAIPQLLWFRRIRMSPPWALFIALCIAVGTWADSLAVLVIGIVHDRLVRPIGSYVPTITEWMILLGSLGLFALIAILFVRFVPVVSIYETRADDAELVA
ncbi:molybdopterin oxidoreductase membrane subunit [Novosphingobium marinum]|uniref:Molybdopterin-containing oxidoreductase family membrane subunit n=1 Tax=Novosphingobium marinum TaxID=1514948 RepID=A0A7Y9XWW7_9SPHN|nr:NrfD/PsrC family molybdoenzyme membrane anchor subunit [Novosphingobium marinum]NYH96062.1 molybdopterin-containing oxidoreductase family membrane subunit [Novosphingobium marinum]GGC32163.1 molybdopterin oxidoreductase membrane subunit [Novosphingobium marinum]